MNQSSNAVVAAAGPVELTRNGFLLFLKSRGQLRGDLIDALVEECLVRAATDAKVRVSIEDVQQVANRFRHRLGLQAAAQMLDWLAEQGLSVDEWEQSLRRQLLIERFAQHLLDEHGQQRYAQAPERFARARLRRIVTTHVELARELLAQLVEEGRTFAELSEQCADIPGCVPGATNEVLMHCQLPTKAAQKIFAAQGGDSVGPFLENDGYVLYNIEELSPPIYDETTRLALKRELFEDFMRQRQSEVTLNWAALTSDS